MDFDFSLQYLGNTGPTIVDPWVIPRVYSSLISHWKVALYHKALLHYINFCLEAINPYISPEILNCKNASSFKELQHINEDNICVFRIRKRWKLLNCKITMQDIGPRYRVGHDWRQIKRPRQLTPLIIWR